MTKIYEQFDAAFKKINAYAVLKNGNHVANINIKYPNDGMGRIFAYVHILGLEMVRDFAGGCGYDKKDTAIKAAVGKINTNEKSNAAISAKEMQVALSQGNWERELEKAGFTVIRVI